MITLTNGVQVPENAVQLQTTAAIDGYYVTQPLRLVQYDETLPVAAVQLTYQNQPYTPPTGAELNVRMGKPDGTTVYNPCLGMDSSGIVYFAFTQQMTAAAGDGKLTVEVTDSGVKNSAAITVNVAENPVQEGSIESADEFLTLQEILAEAEKWGQIVQANASNIQQVVDNLTDIQNAAENAQAAAESAAAAQQAAQEALGFRTFFSAVTPDANGNLDPSRPMTVGPAASVEIESAGDRIQSVTAHGFTTQAGTGDPSPTNVRAITNGGQLLAQVSLSGAKTGGAASVGNGYYRFGITLSQVGVTATNYKGLCSHWKMSVSASDQSEHFYIEDNVMYIVSAKVSTATDMNAYIAENNVVLWYSSSDGTGSLYAPIILTSGEYRATCLPLTAPLCEGDSVVSWARSGCDKVLVLDGTTNRVIDGGPYWFNYAAPDLLAGATVYSDYVPAKDLQATSSYIQIGKTAVAQYGATAEALNEYFASHPLTVWYRSTNYTEAADIPVSLETHQQAALVLDGTEIVVLYWNGKRDQQLANGRLTFSVAGQAFRNGNAAKCSHFAYYNGVTGGVGNQVGFQPEATNRFYFCMDLSTIGASASDIDGTLLSKVSAYLAAQYAAGTPVTIVYQLATPITYAHEAVVLEAATDDQLTYTVTGQAGGTVSVALKPFQDGGHAKTADNAANAQNATQFDGHAWSEVPGQAPVQSVNGKTGAVTLGAEDVGAVPLNHTAVLADGIALKDGSPVNTPADIDHYTMLRIYSNYGAAVCSVPIKGGQTGFLPFINGTSAPNINIVVVNISRTETQLTLETNAALRLATTGITAPGTALSVYRIEGLV